MSYHQLFVGESAQGAAEPVPIMPEEDVDGYAVVAFPPPNRS
jgi:hypothetical protein